MSGFLKKLQDECKQRKSVIFANAKYEIENKLISKEGIDCLAKEVPTSKFETKASGSKIDYQFNYSLPIKCKFILFTLTTLSKLKAMLNLPDKHNFSDDDFSNISVNELLRKEKDLKQLFNEKINNGTLQIKYKNGWMWVTCNRDVLEYKQNCQELINGLGLDHLCDTDTGVLYGLVLKVSEKQNLYKPTFMNYPSETAYCTLPAKNKNRRGYGATMHLKDCKQKFSEALLPTAYFKEQMIEIKRIFIYKPFRSNKIDKENIKRKIMKLLYYNPVDDYEFELINNNINFTKK